ncbi:MAG TPA: hypothetical protein PLJ71_11065 [Candidatus Hydrogenedentes bacterium]|nr:hypothetical protein [Candidatus Hydrogenedentota bacterium]HQM49218.1 hypothetical protein [Candidatus Hydrogenedentota bacterium]
MKHVSSDCRFCRFCFRIGGIALVAIGAALVTPFFVALASEVPASQENAATSEFDVVPFALPNTPANEVWFEDPRDIVKVVVEYSGEPPAGLSYLRKTWPETRVEARQAGDTVGGFGWIHQDDWFNSEWTPAAVKTEGGDRSIAFVFEKLQAELDSLAGSDDARAGLEGLLRDYNVGYRRTQGLRIDGIAPEEVRAIRIFTASPATETTLRVELDSGGRTSAESVALSGYNASIESVEPVSGVEVVGEKVVLGAGDSRAFRVRVRHLEPGRDHSGDEGLVTFDMGEDAFTISLVSLAQEGPVWFPEMAAYIAREEDAIPFSEYRASIENACTIAQRVAQSGEQSLRGAYNGQPRPHCVSYNIGCTHARQRFWVESNGDLVLFKRNVTWVEGKDTARFKSRESARLFFGLDDWAPIARFVDPAPVLAYNVHARKGALQAEYKSFAVPLLTPIASESWAGDDPMAALARFRFRNDGDQPVLAAMPIRYSQDSGRSSDNTTPPSPLDALAIQGNGIYSDFEGNPALRCTFETGMLPVSRDDEVVFEKPLAPGESCELILRVPFIALESGSELAALDGLDFDRCEQQVTAYWREVGRRGAQVVTPIPQLNALYAAHLAHVYVTDFLMPGGSGLINTSVGTSTYGNFSNESCMIVNELDQRGMHEDARRRLELWVKYQGTVPQPGNFTDYDGMYFGAGGFEQGSYNQHHGWVLWCLCEHYLLTQDKAWFDSVAGSVIDGADWVFRQRRNTMTDLPHSRGWERGFLPAGSLEDVTDFYYWLSTNALTWRATDRAARALEKAGHPEAARVRSESDAYRADITKGFEIMRRQAPLVRLSDGRWAPHYPSRLYRRGREIGWIREVLEGSVYLLLSGLYEADSPQAAWILDDFQDNRYPKPPYGYFMEDFERMWFDRAGFSFQPNLLAGLLPYLERDEPEVYIWMFFNAWNACYREEIDAMVEHPLPWLGFSNHAHFKTSDEANAVSWLRYMFVYPTDEALYFGKTLPRAWFAQQEPFGASGVATHYGKAGVRYEPQLDAGRLAATVSLDLVEQPPRTVVRFRHPDKAAAKRVRVNGAPHEAADLERGDVDISGMNGEIKVEIEY